jgi:hypothetical protein
MIWWYQFCADGGRGLDLVCVLPAVSGLALGNGHLKDVLWMLVLAENTKAEGQQHFWDRKFFLSNYKKRVRSKFKWHQKDRSSMSEAGVSHGLACSLMECQ